MQVYTAIKLGSPGPIMFKSSAFGFQWISLTCATITLINASYIFILYYPTQGLKPERQDSLVIPLDNHRTTSWQPMYAQWSPKYAKAVPRCTSSQDWPGQETYLDGMSAAPLLGKGMPKVCQRYANPQHQGCSLTMFNNCGCQSLRPEML